MDPTDGNFLEGPVQLDLRCEEVRGEIFWPEEAQDYDVGGKEENSLANSAFANMSFLREKACGGGCFVKTDIICMVFRLKQKLFCFNLGLNKVCYQRLGKYQYLILIIQHISKKILLKSTLLPTPPN